MVQHLHTSLTVDRNIFQAASPQVVDRRLAQYAKKTDDKKFGEAAFTPCYAPKVCNKLPTHIRQASSVDSFKKQLKTYFYDLAFNLFIFIL